MLRTLQWIMSYMSWPSFSMIWSWRQIPCKFAQSRLNIYLLYKEMQSQFLSQPALRYRKCPRRSQQIKAFFTFKKLGPIFMVLFKILSENKGVVTFCLLLALNFHGNRCLRELLFQFKFFFFIFCYFRLLYCLAISFCNFYWKRTFIIIIFLISCT